MSFFIYGENEINHLKSRDKALGTAIDRIGHIKRSVMPDLFEALVHSVTGQQISTKACDTIWKRLKAKLCNITPETISEISAEEIKSCGMSLRKASYIKGIADNILSGKLDIHSLPALPDSDLLKVLTGIKGIGIWTAEMVMIFSMQRPDIFSWNDLAIHRGLRMLYSHKTVTKELFEKYRKRYSPFSTVASLYLWEISGEILKTDGLP